MAATAELKLTKVLIGNSIENLLVWNYENIATELDRMVFLWYSTESVSGIPVKQTRCPPQPNLILQSTPKEMYLKIYLSEIRS